MTLRRIALGAATAAAAVAAGCGGAGLNPPASESPRETFAKTCGSCHTLKAAGTAGQTGPNLDEIKPDKALVLKTIEEGPSIMPAKLLTGAAADRVARYVAENAGN